MDHAITRAARPDLMTGTGAQRPVGSPLYAAAARATAVGRPPRTWAILLTSANHGTVGPVGSTFSHAGEHHERVQVMEIVEAGAPPAPGVDLPGLVRLELTNEQIAAGAIVRCDHGGSIGRSAAIEVWDAMLGVAPIAAQAGQVAVPAWISVDERLPDDDCQVLAATWFTMTHDQHQDIVSFRRGTGKFSHSDVTHWMPLPPSPAKESK